MKLGAKLISSFGVVAGICTVVGVAGLIGIQKMNSNLREVGEVRLPSVESLLTISEAQTAIRLEMLGLSQTGGMMGEADLRKGRYQRIAEAWSRIEKAWKIYEPLPQTTEEAGFWKQFVPAWNAWKQDHESLIELAREFDRAKVAGKETSDIEAQMDHQLMEVAYKTFVAAEDLLNKLVHINSQVGAETVVAAASQARWIIGLTITIVVIGVAVALVFGWFMARSITRPVVAVAKRAEAIAKGDLTGDPLKVTSKDEVGEVTDSINHMAVSLQTLVGEVTSAANEVASAANEIAASAEEMARGMQEQTDQTTQVSSAVEEMSSTVVEVARKSSDAAGVANDAGEQAASGGEIVEQTVEGMKAIAQVVNASAAAVGELGKRGEQIGEIIAVINDIADQTNLLALNAAIEAARAGEHGRGFAVVADEVRKLAERTTQATEEVAESIKAIQSETTAAVEQMSQGTESVASGVSLAEKAGVSLQSIVEGARNVATMIQSIAAASEQQSAAAEQISRNVESISAVTRQSAEGSSQAASAATQLSAKSEQLQALVSQFRLKQAA